MLTCYLCSIDRRAEFDRLLCPPSGKGMTQSEALAWLKANGYTGIKSRNTVSDHKTKHVTRYVQAQARKAKAALEEAAPRSRIMLGTSRDLATLVRDTVYDDVAKGVLRPQIKDGLRAEGLIDRRKEVGAHNDLMLQIAAVFGGGLRLPPPADSIEGEYDEVDEERDEDEAELRMLASGE